MSDHINELYDKEGNLIGCLLSAEAWNYVKSDTLSKLGLEEQTTNQPEIEEPLNDWETLKEYWDFQYPVDMDVSCECCGNTTEDWSQDDPRKFYLSSATLAGLVTFKCVQCQAKVLKRHFNNEIKVECRPFQDEKISTKEGRF